MQTIIPTGHNTHPVEITLDYAEISERNKMNEDGRKDIAEIDVNMPDGTYVRFFVSVESKRGRVKCIAQTNKRNETKSTHITGEKRPRL